jgi:hypothetical protein
LKRKDTRPLPAIPEGLYISLKPGLDQPRVCQAHQSSLSRLVTAWNIEQESKRKERETEAGQEDATLEKERKKAEMLERKKAEKLERDRQDREEKRREKEAKQEKKREGKRRDRKMGGEKRKRKR